jgi:hypothetical protein
MSARLRLGLEAGAFAGVVGGAVLTLARLLLLTEVALLVVWLSPSRHSFLARFARSYIWVALKAPAHVFVGERSVVPGFDAPIIALGLVTHFFIATAWGTLYGVAAVERSRRVTIALGVLWGAVGALGEALWLSRLVGGGLWANSTVAPVFLIYGLVLADALRRFERSHAPRSRDS